MKTPRTLILTGGYIQHPENGVQRAIGCLVTLQSQDPNACALIQAWNETLQSGIVQDNAATNLCETQNLQPRQDGKPYHGLLFRLRPVDGYSATENVTLKDAFQADMYLEKQPFVAREFSNPTILDSVVLWIYGMEKNRNETLKHIRKHIFVDTAGPVTVDVTHDVLENTEHPVPGCFQPLKKEVAIRF